MHVSPAKHSFGSVTDGRTDRQTDRQTDDGQSDPYVSICFAGDTKIKKKISIKLGHKVVIFYQTDKFKPRFSLVYLVLHETYYICLKMIEIWSMQSVNNKNISAYLRNSLLNENESISEAERP